MVSHSPFAPIPAIVADIRRGRMVIVLDDPNRENEGDLVMAAVRVRARDVAFMANHGRGLICVPMEGRQLDRLRIPKMTKRSEDFKKTGWCVSVDLRRGVTTGISAHDRAKTIAALVNPKTTARDLARPGHVFPLRAVPGGILKRGGHTEAAVDLARLAGLPPAGVICEIVREDGRMARGPDLVRLARRFKLKMCTTGELRDYVASLGP